MAGIQVSGLVKSFEGGVRAVNDVSFSVPDGELVTLLGPSGCGKTTTLRLLAGFETPDDGEIAFGDRTVTSVAKGIFEQPERRHAGMVFQSYAIWPHMTVFENVAYPLSIKSTPKAEIRARVGEALDMLGLVGYESRPATKLSGGQQQRVAIARALVGQPTLLLLDEPLSNLDAKLRAQMRVELLQLQRRLKVTTVYVTHDQTEAMVLSDKVLVMRDGVVQQQGSPREIFKQPINHFVADFVGFTNFIPGTVCRRDNGRASVRLSDNGPTLSVQSAVETHEGDQVMVATRPGAIKLGRDEPSSADGLRGTVVSAAYLGDVIEYHLRVNDLPLVAHLADANTGVTDGQPQVGDNVSVEIDSQQAIVVGA